MVRNNQVLNVLILAQCFPPDMGGQTIRAYNVAKGLLRNGCRVTVVAAVPHYPKGIIPSKYKWKPLIIENMQGLRVIRVFVPPISSSTFKKRIVIFFFYALSSLLSLPFLGKIDVIWADNPSIGSFYVALPFSLVKSCPIVMSVDDLWPEPYYDLGMNPKSFFARAAELLAKIAYTLASAITPTSPAYSEVIHKKYKIELEKIHVIEVGVDSDIFLKPSVLIKKRKQDKYIILYIGSFTKGYDFECILNAAKLLSSNKNIEFVLQGGGPEISNLKSKVDKMGLKNVAVKDVIVERDEVAKIMEEADILLLPLKAGKYIQTSIPSKLYEYQAIGKPIIICGEGEAARYVKRYKLGMVVKPGDHRGLAQTILYLINNPAISENLGKTAKIYVEENLTPTKIGKKMKSVLESVLAVSHLPKSTRMCPKIMRTFKN